MNLSTSTAKPAPSIPVTSEPPTLWRVGTLVYTRRGLAVLFFWLLWGDFAFQMRDRSVPSIIQLLLKKFEASDMVSGLLMGSLPAVLIILICPIISYHSDRHRGPWGRRIPFLLIPVPIVVLTMIGLAYAPTAGVSFHHLLGPASPGLNASILILIGLFWVAFEFASIMANSVFGALVNDVVPQAVMGRFFSIFRAIGLIAGIIFNYSLLGKAETHYQWIFIGISALYGFGFTAMCLKVKEGNYQSAPPAMERNARGFLSAAITYFKECFGTPYYLWYYATVALSVMAFAPFNLFSVFFAKSLGMDMDTYGKCYALTFVISLVLAYPLGSLVDRFHPLRLCMVTLALFAFMAFWGAFCVTSTITFAIALVIQGVLAGSYWTVSASLGQRLLPRARFAEMASASGIVCSLFAILLPPLLGVLLDYTHHAYRHTFMVGFGITVLALGSNAILYSKFLKFGGPHNYQAPDLKISK